MFALIAIGALFGALLGNGLRAAEPTHRLAVVYPANKGDYGAIYDQILEGIREASAPTAGIEEYALDTDDTTLPAWLDEYAPDVIITLGKHSYREVASIPDTAPVVSGAVVFSPNGHSGVSLAVDPERFMETLGRLAPQVELIHVVYNERNSGWLIELAANAAAGRGLELHTHPARDAREAVRHYREIFSGSETVSGAIWLPLDSVIPANTILPLVLEHAWSRNLVVFSNNPSHVRRGALFAHFPDHYHTGRRLLEMALAQLETGSAPRVIPTRDTRLAVNSRTASHLGLEDNLDSLPEIDILYPAGW